MPLPLARERESLYAYARARERPLVVFVSAFVHSIADSEIEGALYVVFS